MPLIVVMDDDAGTRILVSQVLKKEGYQVMAAEDGVKGLALIREYKPDLIVSDVQMPLMDGFAVLESVRSDAALAAIPVILLTSLQDRAFMRQGMTTGADDYLTKPFAPQELRDAVNAQVNKLVRVSAMRAQLVDTAVGVALEEQRHQISKLYERRMAKTLSEQWPDSGFVQEKEKFNSATVLFADMRDDAQWTQRLSSSELGEVVQQFYGTVGDTVHLFGAHYMQFVGDGMLCVFVDAGDTLSVNHGLRAVRAAVGLTDATRRLDTYVSQHFSDRNLPPFALSIALHSGPVAFAKLDGMFGSTGQTTPVGDTVSLALKLFGGQPRQTWAITATVQTARLVTGAVRVGQRAMIATPGRHMPVDAVEILGLI
ncbi:MAG: response regulator [Burkholderiaceae bacterium]